MDDYDPRRLPAFREKKLRLVPEELAALASVEPELSPDELMAFAAETHSAEGKNTQPSR